MKLRGLGHDPSCFALIYLAFQRCLSPDFAIARIVLADCQRGLGQFNEALDACRESVRLEPKNAALHFNLGNTCLRAKRFREAIAGLQECTRADPRDAKGWLSLGMAYLFIDPRADAIKAQGKLQEVDPATAASLQSLIDGKAWLPKLD